MSASHCASRPIARQLTHLFSYNRLNLVFIQIKIKKSISYCELQETFREKQIIAIKIANFAWKYFGG